MICIPYIIYLNRKSSGGGFRDRQFLIEQTTLHRKFLCLLTVKTIIQKIKVSLLIFYIIKSSNLTVCS